jgi:anti-sigma regulatory factor (Ser/Thr protein kinase)
MDERSLPSASPAPAAARAIVRSLQPPLSPPVADAVSLMTSEVVSNALRHGGVQTSQEIVMRVDRRAHNIRVEVLNEGPMFVPEPPFQPNEDRDGGYGLYLVDALAKAWGVDPEGERTKVWFEVDDDVLPSS